MNRVPGHFHLQARLRCVMRSVNATARVQLYVSLSLCLPLAAVLSLADVGGVCKHMEDVHWFSEVNAFLFKFLLLCWKQAYPKARGAVYASLQFISMYTYMYK